jgi:predicted oxidoreductase (fatty acid repression mutant protein)
MYADLLTAFAIVSLASAGIGAILQHWADVTHDKHEDGK